MNVYVVQSNHRGELQRHLKQCGIETLIHYSTPPHCQSAYADRRIPADALPISVELSCRILSLPVGPHLIAPDRQRVVVALRSFAGL